MTTRTPTPTSEAVHQKLDAVLHFLDVTADTLATEPNLEPVRVIAERAADRMRLPQQFTTIALAGTTGSGKSSMFNAFTSIDRSPAGILRPTTSEPYACVWGTLNAADELLDWLGVSSRRRFTRESPLDANDEAGLRGMILLDLPDVDSVEPRHRAEVDRLMHLVDVVVWVCDPQKYADQLVHEGYLRQLASQRSGLIVALNQTDKLLPAHLPKVGADLRQLLDEGGLKDVPLVATSATSEVPAMPVSKRGPVKPKPGPFVLDRAAQGHKGVSALRALLEPKIHSRTAGLEALDRDLTSALRDLSTVVGPKATMPPAQDLIKALLDGMGSETRVQSAVCDFAESASAGLPAPWPTVIRGVALSRMDDLPVALNQASAYASANRPRRVWMPGGKKRAEQRADALLTQEVDKVALRYVIEPVRRAISAYERGRVALTSWGTSASS